MKNTVAIWKDIFRTSSKFATALFFILFLMFTFCLTQLNPYYCFISGSIYVTAIIVIVIMAPYVKNNDFYSIKYDSKDIINAKITLILFLWAILSAVEFLMYKIFTLPTFQSDEFIIQEFDIMTVLMMLLSSSLPFLALSYYSAYLSYTSKTKYAPTLNAAIIICSLFPIYPAFMVVNGQSRLINVDSIVIILSIISIVLSLIVTLCLTSRLRSIEINEYGEVGPIARKNK